MSAPPPGRPALSRRRFVTLLAASTAALLARPALTGAAAVAPPAKRRSAAAPNSADQREIARQRALTVQTVRAIRAHAMPPGTELACTFRPLPARRAER